MREYLTDLLIAELLTISSFAFPARIAHPLAQVLNVQGAIIALTRHATPVVQELPCALTLSTALGSRLLSGRSALRRCAVHPGNDIGEE